MLEFFSTYGLPDIRKKAFQRPKTKLSHKSRKTANSKIGSCSEGMLILGKTETLENIRSKCQGRVGRKFSEVCGKIAPQISTLLRMN